MIYFDNAATTPVNNIVRDAIYDAMNIYGNPSSQHELGKQAKRLIEAARQRIEKALSLADNTIVFTGSGSEADTFAIQAGWQYGMQRGRNKILVSSVEHHAVTRAAEQLKKWGAIIEYIKVDEYGSVDLQDLKDKIDYNTAIVSVMASNNEVGSCNNIYAISDIAHEYGSLFHVDAVQGITHMTIDANIVDMMSVSGHKFGAPKGIGFLYIDKFIQDSIRSYPVISGGGQEFGMRAGTENVPYIVGLARAVELMVEHRQANVEYERKLHDYLLQQICENFPYIKINGVADSKKKNPSILNFSIGYADAASLVEWMNIYDICISSGSACNTGSNKPSHVLMAMHNDEKRAFSSVRVSLSAQNTLQEIDAFIEALKAFEKVYKCQ